MSTKNAQKASSRFWFLSSLTRSPDIQLDVKYQESENTSMTMVDVNSVIMGVYLPLAKVGIDLLPLECYSNALLTELPGQVSS